jgi:hypothetical protein
MLVEKLKVSNLKELTIKIFKQIENTNSSKNSSGVNSLCFTAVPSPSP